MKPVVQGYEMNVSDSLLYSRWHNVQEIPFLYREGKISEVLNLVTHWVIFKVGANQEISLL